MVTDTAKANNKHVIMKRNRIGTGFRKEPHMLRISLAESSQLRLTHDGYRIHTPAAEQVPGWRQTLHILPRRLNCRASVRISVSCHTN
jgi:hypothetical protein